MRAIRGGLIVAVLAIAASATAQLPLPDSTESEVRGRPVMVTPSFFIDSIHRIGFSRDGRTLVTIDPYQMLTWDLESGLLIGSGSSTRPEMSGKILSDGSAVWLHTASQKRTLKIDPAAGRTDPSGPALLVDDALALADALDSMVLFRNRTGSVFLTSPRDPQMRAMPAGPGTTRGAVLNPVRPTVAFGLFTGLVRVFDYERNRGVFDVMLQNSSVTHAVFSPDGRWLAALSHPADCVARGDGFYAIMPRSNRCNGQSRISVWSATTGAEQYSQARSQTFTLAFAPDSRQLAMADHESIQIVDVTTKRDLRTLPLRTLSARAVRGAASDFIEIAFSPDGRHLAETRRGHVHVLDAATGQVVQSVLAPPPARFDDSLITSDGRLMGAVNQGDRIVVREFAPGNATRTLGGTSGTRSTLSLDGRVLVNDTITSSGLRTAVWDVTTEERRCTVDAFVVPNFQWSRTMLSPDGSALARPLTPDRQRPGDVQEGVGLWDTVTCRILQRMPLGSEPPAVEFSATNAGAELQRTQWTAVSPDKRLVAAVSAGNVLRVWDVSTGDQKFMLRVPVPVVLSDTTNPRGVRNRLRKQRQDVPFPSPTITNLEDAIEYDQMPHGVIAVGFSPDGASVATVDRNGQARLWSTEDGRRLATLGDIWQVSRVYSDESGRLPPEITVGSIVFSRDGSRILVTYGGRRAPTLWNVASQMQVGVLKGFATYPAAGAFSPDERLVVLGGWGANVGIVDAATGELAATVRAFGGADWLAKTPDGLFDGSPDAYRQLGWTFASAGRVPPTPMEAFFSDFFRPGLLREVLDGHPLRAQRDLANIDRRVPALTLSPASGTGNMADVAERTVTLKIRGVVPPSDANHSSPGIIRDVRLFRNGSLVHHWHGELAPDAQGAIEVTTPATIVAGVNEFRAYAFNGDNVQSASAKLFVTGAAPLSRAHAYVVAIGVNRYENEQFDLRYAAPDAQLFADAVAAAVRRTDAFTGVTVVTLLDRDATKAGILAALRELRAPERAGSRRVQPEDAVFLFFAGHGWTHDGRFYLIPHDLGYAGPRAALARDADSVRRILDRSVSDLEVAEALEPIDSGRILVVIDSCNSGQLLESSESRAGPFNAKGLAQLAWDKGMFVLTAAQSYQAALETSALQHGYLTYALVEEGLRLRKADRDPQDNQLDVREWFDYVAERVPQINREQDGTRDLVLAPAGGAALVRPSVTETEGQTPRAFYRPELAGGVRLILPR